MTAALKSQTGATANTRSALAARLDLLLRHAITADDFEADVARACTADPEDIWVVLALLDQYHRLGKLPTELFRALKAAADQRGLGRRGVPISQAQRTVRPSAVPDPASTPTPTPTPTPAPTPALPAPAMSAPPASPLRPPAEPTEPTGKVTAPSTVMPKVGTVLRARYRLTAELHQDLRGTLYLAVDQSATELAPELRGVSLLVLTPSDSDVAATLAELRQEFRDARQLVHPNIVRVRELDHDGTWFFLTMDPVSGESLHALFARRGHRALPRATALAILRELGAALAYAHENGVAHGDLQPDYVQISSTGEVRIRGFGAVRSSSSYASCEQLENLPPDRRDDLYALACIAYELLQGTHPFGQLNAAAARGRGLVPSRPMMLTRSQWQALRIGLAWRRENRTVGVIWWLTQMRLGNAAPRLPTLETLVSLPAPRRSWQRPLLLVACLAAVIAAAVATGRLPDRALLVAGLTQLRHTMERPAALWHRLQDTLSSMPAPASANPPREPAAAVSNPPVMRPPSAPAATAAGTRITDPPAARKTALPVIELSSDNYTVLPGESAARIVVRRRGPLQNEVDFSWWTEGASAIPGRDYADWGRRVEQIPAGHASITLLVPIVSDITRRGRTRTFYVAIDTSGSDTQTGETTRAAVLLPGTG